MRGRGFIVSSGGAGAGRGFDLSDVDEIDGVVMDDQVRDIFGAAQRIDFRRGHGRRGRRGGTGGGVAEIVTIDAQDDGFGDGHLAGGRFVAHMIAVFDDVGGDDAAAILEQNGVGGRGGRDQQQQGSGEECGTHTPC